MIKNNCKKLPREEPCDRASLDPFHTRSLVETRSFPRSDRPERASTRSPPSRDRVRSWVSRGYVDRESRCARPLLRAIERRARARDRLYARAGARRAGSSRARRAGFASCSLTRAGRVQTQCSPGSGDPRWSTTGAACGRSCSCSTPVLFTTTSGSVKSRRGRSYPTWACWSCGRPPPPPQQGCRVRRERCPPTPAWSPARHRARCTAPEHRR